MHIRDGVAEREEIEAVIGAVAADHQHGGLAGHLDRLAPTHEASLDGGGGAIHHAGEDRRARGKAAGRSRCRGDAADDLRTGERRRQLGRVEFHGRDQLGGPTLGRAVEEHGERPHGVVHAERAAEPVGDVAVGLEHLVGAGIQVGRMLLEPEQLGGQEVGVDAAAVDGGDTLLADYLTQPGALFFRPAVHPDKGRTERLAGAVDGHKRRRLVADRDGGDLLGVDAGLCQHTPDDLAGCAPPVLRILFSPVGMWVGRRVFLARLRHDAAFAIAEDGLGAGGADIDAGQVDVAHSSHPISHGSHTIRQAPCS